MKDDLTDKMAESYQNNGMPIALKVSSLFSPSLASNVLEIGKELMTSTLPMEVLEKSYLSSVDELLRTKA